MADTPMTPEEERVARAWIDAAAREVDFVRGGIFDIAARAFATLDAERARQPAPSEGLREALAELLDHHSEEQSYRDGDGYCHVADERARAALANQPVPSERRET